MRELKPTAWSRFFEGLSEELYNAPVSIEVVGRPFREADHLALQALMYDRKDDVVEIAAAVGGPRLPGTVRRLITHPRRIYVDSPPGLRPMTVAIDEADGVRTLVRLEPPAQFGG